MNIFHPYTIFPLGDTALTLDFGNYIDEGVHKKLLHLFAVLQKERPPFITDIIPAYTSLTLFYDVSLIAHVKPDGLTVFETVAAWVEQVGDDNKKASNEELRMIRIPVCYEEKFAPDLAWVAKEKALTKDEVVSLHVEKIYRVFMIGFLPGFAYMGEVDEKIVTTRKAVPSQRVTAGSVGIAGKQTGIYPLNSPGGWRIIGQTPVKIFDQEKEEPVLFHPGDTVQFYSITEDEFAHHQARNT